MQIDPARNFLVGFSEVAVLCQLYIIHLYPQNQHAQSYRVFESRIGRSHAILEATVDI